MFDNDFFVALSHGFSVTVSVVFMLLSILMTAVIVLLGLTIWRLAFQHRDYPLYLLGGSFCLFASLISQVGISIASNHFDMMQVGHSAFDTATYSAGRVCLISGGVLFFGWLLTSAFQRRSEKPRK